MQAVVHERVGTLIATWANTESLFCGLFQHAADLSRDNAAIIFFSLSSNYARMDMLRALVEANMTGPDQTTAIELIQRMKGPTRTRNDLAHCEYDLDVQTLDYRGTYAFSREKKTTTHRPLDNGRINEITHAVQTLNTLNGELLRFIPRLRKPAG